jgi:hypothetical protein
MKSKGILIVVAAIASIMTIICMAEKKIIG